MSGELPILWWTRQGHTVAVFYESRSGLFRVVVWHESGLTAAVWFRASREPARGVDSEDMVTIDKHVQAITHDLDLASGGLSQ
jgi:hypothetical protein